MRPILLILFVMAGTATADDAERKAVTFLSGEVPRWTREHHCVSCHDNGDAARALYRAKRAGLTVAPGVLDDTTRWLARPEGWDANGPPGPVSDKSLARIEFGLAVVEAVRSGDLPAVDVLQRAAERVVGDQSADRFWSVEDGGAIGAPATYGRVLATASAVMILKEADAQKYVRPIARGKAWLRERPIENTIDAAAVLMVEPSPIGTDAARRSITFLIRAQSTKTGAWGPFRDSPAEPFDTALALIALAPFRDQPGLADSIRRGRSALIAMQVPDGSWPETTRPAGGESHAERLSTAGWATLALIASRAEPAAP